MYHKERGKLPNKNQNFKGVSIAKKLYADIEAFVEANAEYRSVAEFVSEAARLRMEERRKQKVADCQED